MDAYIESRGNRCEVVEDNSFEERCVFYCPTPTPSPQPDSGSPVLYTENVQTKIEISPKLKLTLNRSACFGSCPNYNVTVFGDGTVVYEGENFVPTEGTIEKQISKDQLQQIVAALEEANFYGFVENPHRIVIMDSSNLSISLETDGKIHPIRDGGICSYVNKAGLYEFCDLGDKIDEILEMPW